MGFQRLFDAMADAAEGVREFMAAPVRDDPYISSLGTHCFVDGAPIVVMSFKDTGVCSELCRKRRDGEISEEAFQEHKKALK